MSVCITPDGTCIIVHPDHGSISRRTREEAEAELRRRQAEARPVVPAYSPWGMRA